MAGQQALLLFGFLLPGLLFSEAAKILTVSLVGKCLTEDPETGKQPLVRVASFSRLRQVFYPGWPMKR